MDATTKKVEIFNFPEDAFLESEVSIDSREMSGHILTRTRGVAMVLYEAAAAGAMIDKENLLPTLDQIVANLDELEKVLDWEGS